ncbi:glycoside hydrolase family 13 protein [Capilliphycus salinus ALCB114379]|uniref:glycoside hydrolase family 13 protein n=1 Tax=Capilliphycus salinus TaxID=2768948 RepID=UPI0039A666EE
MDSEISKIGQLPEFIFGHLSTKEGRLKQARTTRVGFDHDSALHPHDPAENQAITISVRVGVDIAIKAVTLYYTTDGTLPQVPSANPDRDPHLFSIPMRRTEIQWDTLQWGYLETWTAEIPGQPKNTHIQYLIQGMTNTGTIVYSPYFDTAARELTDNLDDFDLPFIKKQARKNSPQIYGFYVDNETIPTWLREAVIYQIFVDRFAPDPDTDFSTPKDLDGFYGGTLRGITSKLDYLADLGINCLWLTPIFPSSSYHGYDPTDYGSVEARLGTEEDFQILLDEAHRRNIRVVLDYVTNHLSNQHPAFIAAQKDQTDSAYKWFDFINWPDEYECFFNVPSQPKIDSDCPQARAYLIENAQRWLERGVDGFRLDCAHGSTHAFWSCFRTATRAVNPDSVTFGEITSFPAFIRSFAGRMDGCLDFKLLEILRGFFAFGTLKVSEFDKILQQHYAYFNSNLVLPSFLDNHDMNRFLWTVKGDQRRLRLAALCQFTLPEPPIIYYGTEVGLSQLQEVGRLEESRLPMLWGKAQDSSLLEFYKNLIGLRRQIPEIWNLPRQTLLADDRLGVYAYLLGSHTVVLNNSSEVSTISLSNLQDSKLLLSTSSSPSWNPEKNQLQLSPFAGAIFQQLSS